VNVLGPGHINTAIGRTAGLSQEENDAYFERTALDTPLGRNGEAHDIAAAALYLASDESAFVTGIELRRTEAARRSVPGAAWPLPAAFAPAEAPCGAIGVATTPTSVVS
jgi:NAD(P)-dependent dehydrogenase (short-subunit alcohol dehydrogenase family)